MQLPAASENIPFRILVLSTDDALGRQLYLQLEKTGFEVRRITEAIMGLAMWEGFNPHLVIADARPGGLDGLAICKQARGEELFAPLILLGPQDEAREIAGLKAGADDYLPEPLRLPAILARVVAHLRRAYQYNVPAPVAAEEPEADESAAMQPFWEEDPALAASVAPEMSGPATDVLPSGWTECELCGHRAPREEFEKEDITGKIRLVCPNCKESEHVVYSLN